MKPVDQTLFGNNRGNCFAACVASIFEVPLDSLPNFCCDSRWPDNYDEWLARRGLGRLTLLGNGGVPAKALGIGAGPSPRGDFLHACVYIGGVMLYDPHPSREGLLCLKETDFFVLLDPRLRGEGSDGN